MENMEDCGAETYQKEIYDPYEKKEIIINSSDLSFLKDLRIKHTIVMHEAEKAQLKTKISELEFKVAVQEIYLKYGIAITDSVDETTGKVTKIADKKED